VIKDENGKTIGAIASGEDLTEQRNAEKELQKIKAKKVLKDQMK
jgi:signal transduction histidine kinase